MIVLSHVIILGVLLGLVWAFWVQKKFWSYILGGFCSIAALLVALDVWQYLLAFGIVLALIGLAMWELKKSVKRTSKRRKRERRQEENVRWPSPSRR